MKILYICSLSMLLVSCSNKKNENPPIVEALDDKTTDIISYTRNSNLVDKLYQELVEKNPTLKKLETDIAELNAEKSLIDKEYNSYGEKSTSYYSAAYQKTTAMQDSSLRNQINNYLSASQVEYKQKTRKLDLLINEISASNTSITDYYAALKIVLTLYLIEDYQKQYLPKTDAHNKLIGKQKIVQEELEKKLPKL